MVVDALIKGGVQHAFGIAGVHNLPIYDALPDRGTLKTYATRHEQGAGFMADGYARVSGRPGVVLVTTGPGLTNTVTPLAGAWSDSVPMLVIGTAGEVNLLGKYKGYLHEFRDQHGVMDAAGAGSTVVLQTAELERATLGALLEVQSGRPRPLVLEVPIDVLADSSDAPPAAMGAVVTPAPSAEAIRHTAEVLHAATYPLLFAGGGAARAGDPTLVLRLAEMLRAPVLTSVNGKGALPDDSPWSAGCTWRNSSSPRDGYPDVWLKADRGLVIGSRLTAMSTRGWQLPLPERLHQLDIDEGEIGKNYPVEHGLVGDAGVGLEMLIEELGRLALGASRWSAAEIRAARDADDEAGARQCPKAIELMQALRAGLGDDGILACDQAIACYWAVRHFKVSGPRQFLYPTGSAVLGFGLPAGIGAQVAAPDTPVCALVGDGGFLFTGTELATAVQYELPVTVVICNDNAYGMIKLAQEQRYGRAVDTVLRNPDFVAYGRAFGAYAEKLSRPRELAGALRDARQRKGPTVLVLDIALGVPYH